jgi:GGDEF domain-containing protein
MPANGRRSGRTDQQRGIDGLLSSRVRIAVPLSVVFLTFSVLDWMLFPEHAEHWLGYRIATLALILLVWGLKIIHHRRGYALALLYALAFSSAMSIMTFESGGFSSPYYVGLLVLLSAIFVLFPLDLLRGSTVLACVLVPYIISGALHGEADAAVIVANLTFVLAVGAFLVLGGHLSTRVLMDQIESRARLQALVNELEDSSRRDPLTHLFNRRHLNNHLARVLPVAAGDPPMCFAIADIDDFKHVNDSLGHQAGDHVLAQVARTLRASTRTEEERASERIRAAIAVQPFTWNGNVVPISMSIGVAPIDPGASPESVIHRADESLFRAKRAGRNQVISYLSA